MDDHYALAVAMSEFREGWNAGDPGRVLSAFADEFTNWSEDTPSFYGAEGRRSMELHLKDIFAKYRAEMTVQMIDTAVAGDSATSRGWLNLKLFPRDGGEPTFTKYRYLQNWRRMGSAGWKIKFLMTNRELPPQMLPQASAA
jgi:ketosteroid isomerase-like protein